MNKERTRIKYDGDNDLSLTWKLERAERMLQITDFNDCNHDVNSIIELYNIYLLIKSGSKLTAWNDDNYKVLKSNEKKIMSIVGRFFSNIDLNYVTKIYKDISPNYAVDFWELISKFNTYEKFDKLSFSKFLNNENINLFYLLRFKNIVRTFDCEISKYMKEKQDSGQLLISHHLEFKNSKSVDLYLPESLSKSDQLNIIANYIDSQEVNPNYLILIFNARTGKDSVVTEKLRLKSKKRYDEIMSDEVIKNSGFNIGTTIGFTNIDQYRLLDYTNIFDSKFIYDSKWIEKNLDYPTILNNFIFLFEFTDYNFISNFPSKVYEMSNLENISRVRGNKYYNESIYFNVKESISDLQMMAYYLELKKYDISLELIFKWFFEEYLVKEFQAESFLLKLPSENSNYVEKISIFCQQIDSIIKQFCNYVDEGVIDLNLVKIMRNTPLFEHVPSFNSNKYGYIEDEDLKYTIYLLFSNQSPLAYKEHLESYENFSDIIRMRDSYLNNFFDYQIEYINYLIDRNIIIMDSNEKLTFNDEALKILEYYYKNEVLCITYLSNNEYLKELTNNEKIIFEGTLFSRNEVDYLNYMLNDRSFDNGLALRNKYSHGSYYEEDDEIYKIHYFKILKIFTLLIIKINEEFCRRDDTWNNLL